MLVIRPVTTQDHAELLTLAREAGIGMTSLPADAEVLEQKISRAVASFTESGEWKGDEAFLFVLEDTETGKPVGTAGIISHVGLKSPFYSYKLSTIVQASKDADIYSQQKVLHMVNDYTGVTEIGSLFLKEQYRRDGIGRLLSRARFLMMAQFPQFFSERVIAEIRGVQVNGESPFYQHLGQHFFQMPYARADLIVATVGSQFISDLMPKYPIYVSLLHEDAQRVIGQPFEHSKIAMHLLEKEGFIYQGYIDLFDAGPTMQIQRVNINTVKDSKLLTVAGIGNPSGERMMVSNTSLKDFRIVAATVDSMPNGITLDAATTKALGVGPGDKVRVVAL